MSETVIRRAATLRKTAYQLLELASEIESDALFADRVSDINCRVRPIRNAWSERETAFTVTKSLDLYRARRLRNKFLPAELFGEPAWDMLLDLFAARLQKRRISITSACIAAAVPTTTALRWIGLLEEHGLAEREASRADARVRWVHLTDAGEAAMTACLEATIDAENRAQATIFDADMTGQVA